MKSLLNIAEIISSKNCFYILTHKYPDGDTLGSAYALCRALQQQGKKAKVLSDDVISKKYEFIKKYVQVEDFNPEFIISVDVADTSQLDDSLIKYADKIDLCIDHHLTNRNYADVTFVDSVSASTAEIIYSLIKEMNIAVDKEIAECIYLGISTDTGCFRYSNVTTQAHRITAELIEKGINLSGINKALFYTKSKTFLNLESMMYKSIEYFFQGRCAVMFVTVDMIKKSGVPENELDGIASIPKGIDGVDIGITIREKNEGIYKVSVRTCDNINATNICEEFGGGGHSCAAGFTMEGTLEDVRSKILLCVKEKLKV